MASGVNNVDNPFSFTNFVVSKPNGNSNNMTANNGGTIEDSESEDNPFSLHNFMRRSKTPKSSKSLKIVDDDVEAVLTSQTNNITDFLVNQDDTNNFNDEDLKDSDSDSDDSYAFPVNYNGDEALQNSPQSETYILDGPPTPNQSNAKGNEMLNQTECHPMNGEASYLMPEKYKLPSDSIRKQQMKVNNEITQLEKENERLREDLQKVREEYLDYRSNANKRIGSLQKELEKARKKEADETTALEGVVHMVEKNLQETTHRAVKAETTVTRLKEEIRFMKEESVPWSTYNRLLEEHNSLLSTIHSKSQRAAQLMSMAAEKTEPHLRQLQSGVDTLRMLAEQFDDISKVSDIPSRDPP